MTLTEFDNRCKMFFQGCSKSDYKSWLSRSKIAVKCCLFQSLSDQLGLSGGGGSCAVLKRICLFFFTFLQCLQFCWIGLIFCFFCAHYFADKMDRLKNAKTKTKVGQQSSSSSCFVCLFTLIRNIIDIIVGYDTPPKHTHSHTVSHCHPLTQLTSFSRLSASLGSHCGFAH